MKLISIVAPCYNEEKNIPLLYERVAKVFQDLYGYDFEIIYIDNVSTDQSYAAYQKVTEKDSRVQVLVMARNTGNSQASFLAGMRAAKGEALVLIEGDIQDPPELIPDFLTKWEEGYDIVYGIRVKRRENMMRRIAFAAFYRVFRWLSYLDIPLDAGDFSLWDRRVVDIVCSLSEKDLYIRGLRSWAGFKQGGVAYTRDDRQHGRTSNSFLHLFSWAKRAIVNFSYKPLEYISQLAFASVVITVIAAIYYLADYAQHGAPRGFPTLLMAIFIFNAIQLLVLSVIAEYLIRIFTEVKNRPSYLIQEVIKNGVKEKA